MEWIKLESIDQLEEADRISNDTPVMLFKHSTRCSISSMALSRLEREWKGDKIPKAFYLDLIAHRDISNAIAERYGIQHQSPQALVVVSGKCVHDSSHGSISVDDMEAAV